MAVNRGSSGAVVAKVNPLNKVPDGPITSRPDTRPSPTSQKSTAVALTGRVSKTGLPLLMDDRYDPAGCELKYSSVGVTQTRSYMLVATDDLGRLIVGGGGLDGDRLWVPPAEPVKFALPTAMSSGETTIAFSQDGKHYAYVGRTEEANKVKFVLVRDGEQVVEYVGGGGSSPVNRLEFSPDGSRLFEAGSLGKAFVAINGEEVSALGGFYRESRSGMVWNRSANVRTENNPRPPDCSAWRGVFSPDSKRTAYQVYVPARQDVIPQEPAKIYMIVDGKAQFVDGECSQAIWSPDSKHLAWIVQKDQTYIVYLDGAGGKPYQQVTFSSVTFSMDSNHMVYMAYEDNMWTVVCDRVEGKKYADIDARSLYVTDDGLAHYVASTRVRGAARAPTYMGGAISNDPQVRVEGAKETPINGFLVGQCTSPDGKKHAMLFRDPLKDTGTRIEIDGVTRKIPDNDVSLMAFSPSGQHFAYIGPSSNTRDPRFPVAVDGVVVGVPATGRPNRLAFMDEETLRWVCRDSVESWRVIDIKVAKKE